MNDLRRIRIDKRMSQFDLSQKSRVHPSRISRIEGGQATPSVNEINRIAAALGMLPEEVFGLDVVVRPLSPRRKKESE